MGVAVGVAVAVFSAVGLGVDEGLAGKVWEGDIVGVIEVESDRTISRVVGGPPNAPVSGVGGVGRTVVAEGMGSISLMFIWF